MILNAEPKFTQNTADTSCISETMLANVADAGKSPWYFWGINPKSADYNH